MNAHGLTSLGMAADVIGAAIKELQTTADHQLRIEHIHRWKDTSVSWVVIAPSAASFYKS